MRYHYEPPTICVPVYGETYRCNHPVYSKCTLYTMEDRSLAVIQQRYYFRNPIFLHPKFMDYFNKMAGPCAGGLYPTVTIRQLMWALKMKPLKRQPWETCFDHSPI